VRAGALSSADAQRRRQLLEQECALHGAMDGAMKFVKGDAIASIVIALVNILAGLAIGTLMNNMSVGDALQRYAILTVGDGMVSQIPSLLVSIAAGVVITRVGSGDAAADRQLANQIAQQLFAHPRALLIAGVAVASFLIVPGFPKWVFALLALTLVAAGLLARSVRERRRTPTWISHPDAEGSDAADAPQAIAAPLAVRLANDLRGSIDLHTLDQQLTAVKATVEGDLGPVFPRLQVAHAKDVAPSSYDILVKDVPVSRGALRPGWRLLQPESATALPAGAEVAEPFGPFARVAWVRNAGADTLSWSCEEVLGRHVEHVVRRHVPQMIGLQEVQRLLRSVQADAPELAAEASRAVPAQRIAEVLRRLLQEGIPIRNLHAIFESLALWGTKETDAIALTELVRIDLGHYITSRHAGASRQVAAILFESSLLDRVQQSIERSARGNLLLLSPAVTQDVREQVRRILGASAGTAVAIVSSDVRRYIKTLIEPIAPDLTVLSYQEIDADVALQPVGWVTNPQQA
jgi:type III secretion protein V